MPTNKDCIGVNKTFPGAMWAIFVDTQSTDDALGDSDVVLGPQRRSFQGGCHVSSKPSSGRNYFGSKASGGKWVQNFSWLFDIVFNSCLMWFQIRALENCPIIQHRICTGHRWNVCIHIRTITLNGLCDLVDICCCDIDIKPLKTHIICWLSIIMPSNVLRVKYQSQWKTLKHFL